MGYFITFAYHRRLMTTNATSHVGPVFMTRFGCIGADCEDNCCTWWRIPVDQSHYEKLRVAMSHTKEDQAQFRGSFKLTPGPNKRHFALVLLDENHNCKLLDPDKLCSLHRRYGEEVLPDTCSIYPRVIGRIGGRMEIGAELSCPEAARRCLLTDDAMDLVELDPALAARGVERQLFPDGNSDSYYENFDEVRGLMYALLSERAYPIASRLFFLAHFADRVNGIYGREAKAFDGARLADEVELIMQQSTLRALHEQYDSLRLQGSIAPGVVIEVLSARYDGPQAYRRLLDAVLTRAYERLGEQSAAPSLHALGHEKVFDVHKKAVAAMSPQTAKRLEMYLENYCKNLIMQQWFIASPTLMRYLLMLFARVALVRFLLVGHPLLETDPDRAAVEAVYSVTRAIDHNAKLLSNVENAFEAKKVTTLAHAVSLIKF
jgi:lysine-N-methylase